MALISQTACFFAGILLGMGFMCLLLAGKRIEIRLKELEIEEDEQRLQGGAA